MQTLRAGVQHALFLGLAALLTPLLAAQVLDAPTWRYEKVARPDGLAPLEVAILEPGNVDRTTPVPVLLGLPPGQQNRDMGEVCMQRYWGSRVRNAGWVVICPVAPVGPNAIRFDADEDAAAVGTLCGWIRSRYAVEGNGIHLAGVSNGGRAAFRSATRLPWQFASLTVLPGFPSSESDRLRLPSIGHLPLRMFVGGKDHDWKANSEKTLKRILDLGGDATLRVFEGEGHVPKSLTESIVLETLEALRRPVGTASPESEIHRLIDGFHTAAAQADEARYFGMFADDESIFMGTDATERWTVPEFRKWSTKAFAAGRDAAWTFVPLERHVRRSTAVVAWFDERLGNASFGECRGSGVVLRLRGEWRIAHYNLTIPVPNDLAYALVDDIRAHELTTLQDSGDAEAEAEAEDDKK